MENNPEIVQQPEILEDIQGFIATGELIYDSTKARLLHMEEQDRAEIISANIDAAEKDTDGHMLRVDILTRIIDGDEGLLKRMRSAKPEFIRLRDGREGLREDPFGHGRHSNAVFGSWLSSDER